MDQWQCFYYKIINRSPIDRASDQFFYEIDDRCRRHRCHRRRQPTVFQPVGSIDRLRDEWKNKAGYTALDAPSMRTFHLRKQQGTILRTDGQIDTTSYRDATAHLKTGSLQISYYASLIVHTL